MKKRQEEDLSKWPAEKLLQRLDELLPKGSKERRQALKRACAAAKELLEAKKGAN